jgi:hypothetical protein
VPFELECAPQRLAHGSFVVDDQDLHETIVLVEFEKRLRTRFLASS